VNSPEHAFSLATLMQIQIARGARRSRENHGQRDWPKPRRGAPTSIRLDPNTLHFLHSQAEAMNTSLQAVIGIILDSVAQATETWARDALQDMPEGDAR
jgi:hypothetical protein